MIFKIAIWDWKWHGGTSDDDCSIDEEGQKMKLEDLVILHFEGTSSKGVVSDKVWGRFQMDGEWSRFWGKSTAAKFQTGIALKYDILEAQDKKIKKGYSNIDPDSQLFKDVAHVLESQFGISPELLRSLVTGEEVEGPIKPSEVVATKMEGDIVIFWDEQGDVIGTRPRDQWDKIQEHMFKSRFIKGSNADDGTLYWGLRED